MSKVMRSNPNVKHGKRLEGKMVIARSKTYSQFGDFVGTYENISRIFFRVLPSPMKLDKSGWNIEEIVESEE